MKFKIDAKKKVDNKEGITKIPLKFDISMLNMFIGFSMKKSGQITRKSLNNLKKLFDIVDERVYMGNDKLSTRIYFIKRALHARVTNCMENPDIIINFCRTDNYDENVEEIIQNLDLYTRLNFEEIKFINKAVKDRLQYFNILKYKDKIYETVERLDSGEYESFEEINVELLDICKKVISDSRKSAVLDDNNTFSLEEGVFEDAVTDIAESLKDPSKILNVGIQCLNTILAPGYRSKRLYLYMGLPAGFKSGILLKSCYDIKKYNKGIKTKEGKRPCVLLVTMENTVEETVERLFNMTVTPDDIRDFDTQDIISKLKNEGGLTLDGDDDIDIIIKYYPNRSIDTSDLYTIIEELSDDNKEVIALVLDYIKRIKPAEYGRDEKEELKNITNELHSLAVDFNIPVISGHQLNRAGAGAVDAAMTANKEDLGRFVGRSNVGSAWEVRKIASSHSNVRIETSLIAGNSLELKLLN